MALSRRHGLVFAAGVLFGVVAGASLVMVAHGPGGAAMMAATAQPMKAAAPPAADCPFEPVLTAAHGQDGKFFMEDAQTQAAAPSDIAAYITVGTTAASQGRLRDAEVAYITSCRIATRVAGVNSAELADAKYALASHYVNAAATLKAPELQPTREEAHKRAEALFTESIDGYGIKYGVAHEKTRLAAAGLSAVKEATAVVVEEKGMPRDLLEAKVRDYATVAALKPKRKRVVEEEVRETVAESPAPPSTREMGAPPAPLYLPPPVSAEADAP